jgi:Fe-S-cluster containining protein
MPHDIHAISESLSLLYDRIDRQVNRIVKIHAGRLHCCRGCVDCCIDDISINEAEAMTIRHHYADLLKNKKPHPRGACAFLDGDNSCRIYERRPYVCRTQGLPLHWIEEKGGKMVALRDICPRNEKGTPIEKLPEDDCWKIGPVETELAKLQNIISKGLMRRVKLREMFII